MENKNVEIIQFDPSGFRGKIFYRISSDAYQEKGFYRNDILIVDWDKPLQDSCVVVVMSKGVFHIREVTQDGDEFYIKPEDDEFFIPLLITETVRKAIAGSIIQVIKSL